VRPLSRFTVKNVMVRLWADILSVRFLKINQRS
jgi:hypothetical protein